MTVGKSDSESKLRQLLVWGALSMDFLFVFLCTKANQPALIPYESNKVAAMLFKDDNIAISIRIILDSLPLKTPIANQKATLITRRLLYRYIVNMSMFLIPRIKV